MAVTSTSGRRRLCSLLAATDSPWVLVKGFNLILTLRRPPRLLRAREHGKLRLCMSSLLPRSRNRKGGRANKQEERAGAESYSTQRTAKNRTCRQKNMEREAATAGQGGVYCRLAKGGAVRSRERSGESRAGERKVGGQEGGWEGGRRRLLARRVRGVNLACPMAVLELTV